MNYADALDQNQQADCACACGAIFSRANGSQPARARAARA